MLKHLCAVLMLILVIYFIPDGYELYLAKLEFPRLRASVRPSESAYSYGDYSPVIPAEAPEEYVLVIVRQEGHSLEERYYSAQGAVTTIVYRDGMRGPRHISFRGDTIQILPGRIALAYLTLITVAIVVRKRTLSAGRWRWNALSRAERLAYLYGIVVFLCPIVFGLTGLWP